MAQTTSRDFNLTLIDGGHLAGRLAIEIGFLKQEFARAWPQLKKDPIAVGTEVWRRCITTSLVLLSSRNALTAFTTALLIVTAILLTVVVVDRRATLLPPNAASVDETEKPEMVMLDLARSKDASSEVSVGRDGKGRVGFNRDKGEGSGAEQKRAQGGGTSGNRELLPPQQGKLPPPSTILAAIPKTPPLTQPALPAGIDIDPALFKDLKAPVFGDPRSTSEVRSNGPGVGGGIGTNEGLGLGNGGGPGFGPGTNGNMGGNDRQTGCCGPPGGARDNSTGGNRIFRGPEVEQRARLLSKPEPQYTEEARRNQIMGTVMLRVVFSSLGEVTQIHAVQTLPFGLTERAIAAARQIRFLPATKSGHPVSVYMQLEYNFNLY